MEDVQRRLGALEKDIGQVMEALGRLELAMTEIRATVPHLATKVDVEQARSDLGGKVSQIRVDLAEKPGKTYLWMVLAVLVAAVLGGMALMK